MIVVRTYDGERFVVWQRLAPAIASSDMAGQASADSSIDPGVAGSNRPVAETVDTVFNLHGLPIEHGVYVREIEYDPLGRHSRTTMGPAGSQAGLVLWTTYSPVDGRVSRQVADTRAGQRLQDDRYTYDPVGNPTAIRHVTMWDSETECFDYDARQRLTTAVTVAAAACPANPGGTAASGPAPYKETYAIDRLHRIVNFDGSTRTHNPTNPTGCTGTAPDQPHAIASTSGAGRTETFDYSCAGQLIEHTVTRPVVARRRPVTNGTVNNA